VIFIPRSTLSLGPNFSQEVSLAPCHCCTAGHLPAGDSQLLPGSTITSGQFLWLSKSPCSWLPAPMPLLPSPDRFHYGIFLRGHLMLRYGLHRFSIRLSLLCICLLRFLARRPFFPIIPHICYPGVHLPFYGLDCISP
jgi:hypothetical protein